jgi:hypothetical protein
MDLALHTLSTPAGDATLVALEKGLKSGFPARPFHGAQRPACPLYAGQLVSDILASVMRPAGTSRRPSSIASSSGAPLRLDGPSVRTLHVDLDEAMKGQIRRPTYSEFPEPTLRRTYANADTQFASKVHTGKQPPLVRGEHGGRSNRQPTQGLTTAAGRRAA